jgi:hypothetical protein
MISKSIARGYKAKESIKCNVRPLHPFFGGTGVWTQGFMLAKQMVFYSLSRTSSQFCSDYFGDGGLINYLPRLASNHDPPDLSLPSG